MKQFMHRLWWRVWLAVLASLAVFAILGSLAWHYAFDPARVTVPIEVVGEIAAELQSLPNTPASNNEIAQGVLLRWHQRTRLDLALFTSAHELIAAAGRPVPPPKPQQTDSHWIRLHQPSPDGAAAQQPLAEHGPGHEAGLRLMRAPFAWHLEDGRWLVARREVRMPSPPFGLATMLLIIAALIGAGTYPVVRRLTRRLETLQAGVEAFGKGDLGARVALSGADEAGQLGTSFNAAAQRIETLVQGHKALLANASHELRSPLTRMRMALEMMQGAPTAELQAELKRSMAELDALVEEVLLASRMDARALQLTLEDVDVAALAAEECARAGAVLELVKLASGAAAPLATNTDWVIRADARLLRRILRNLLDNARRYARNTSATTETAHTGIAIDVVLTRLPAILKIEVLDRGIGIPEAELKRVFEPFYRATGTRDRDGGVGIGLSLVRQIAHEHGGEVTCAPRNGGGTCFTVELPAG
jgi:signal transduction histidine kinase